MAHWLYMPRSFNHCHMGYHRNYFTWMLIQHLFAEIANSAQKILDGFCPRYYRTPDVSLRCALNPFMNSLELVRQLFFYFGIWLSC